MFGFFHRKQPADDNGDMPFQISDEPYLCIPVFIHGKEPKRK